MSIDTQCNHLVITGTPILVGFARVSVNTHRALDQANAFFKWCSEHPQDPMSGVLSSIHDPAGQQWRELVIAQSMDMFADSGMNAVNWTASLVEALNQVAYLCAAGDHYVQLDGFKLNFHRAPGPEHPGQAKATPLQSQKDPNQAFVALTMEGVSQQLSAFSGYIPQMAKLVERLNPEASRVEHSVLVSALLTLMAMGPLTSYRAALVGGPADPWHARMQWDFQEDVSLSRNGPVKELARQD